MEHHLCKLENIFSRPRFIMNCYASIVLANLRGQKPLNLSRQCGGFITMHEPYPNLSAPVIHFDNQLVS